MVRQGGSISLDAAALIASALVDAACWDGERCAWPDATGVPADLWGGSAGIALFLLALDEHAPGRAIRATAAGALRHAISDFAARDRKAVDFFRGPVGVAYAASRAASAWRDNDLFDRSRALLASQSDADIGSLPFDVASGAAGSIPALLQLAEVLDHRPSADLAVRLGEHLVGNAVREGWGWSWPTSARAVVRWPIGFAHGTSGIAFALLELFRVVGDGRFRWAAEQALAYEMSFFDMRAQGWPDLLGPRVGGDQNVEQPTPSRAHIALGWSDGTAGIGLARTRAWQTLSAAAYADHVQTAATATRGAMHKLRAADLATGLAGAGEFLLVAGDVFHRRDWMDAAEEVLQRALERLDSGNDGGITPGLMRGAAGVGLFALRLHDRSIPNPLLLGTRTDTEMGPPRSREGWHEGYLAVAYDDAEFYFGKFARPSHVVPVAQEEPAPQPGFAAWQAVLEEAAAGAAPTRSSAIDQARIELLLAPCDFLAEERSDSRRLPPDRLSFGPESVIRLSPRIRFVPGSDPAEDPEMHNIVWRSGRDLHVERLGPEAARVLSACSESQASLRDLFGDSPDLLCPPGDCHSARGYAEIRDLYARGFIDVLQGNALTSLGEEISDQVRSPHSPASFVEAGIARVHKALAGARDLLSKRQPNGERVELQAAFEMDECMYMIEMALESCYSIHLIAPQVRRYWSSGDVSQRATVFTQIYQVLKRIFAYPALLRANPL